MLQVGSPAGSVGQGLAFAYGSLFICILCLAYLLNVWELEVLLLASVAHALLTNKVGAATKACKSSSKQKQKQKHCTPSNLSFHRAEWENDAHELLKNMSPPPEVHRGMHKLMQFLEEVAVRCCGVGAEVSGTVHGNPLGNRPWASAVPDIEVTVTLNLERFVSQMEGAKDQGAPDATDKHRISKRVLRVLMKDLVNMHSFRFRRTYMTDENPRMILQVPSSHGFFQETLCVEITVNGQRPNQCAELLARGNQFTPLSGQLILLVQSWARERGINCSARGHLSPYAWIVLVLFYLQARRDKGITGKTLSSIQTHAASIGALFQGFFRFYDEDHDFHTNIVCTRTGQQAKCDSHAIQKTPCIRDPFSVGSDLGSAMSADGFLRFREELSRANELCSQGAPLSELLRQRCPAEARSESE